MITEIRLKNVRLFSGKEYKFPLSPLTIFCGTNSCGKSTILRTLLLFRQSQGIYESYATQSGKLRFVGSQVDMGDYSSFVSHRDVESDIVLSLKTTDKISEFLINELKGIKVENNKEGSIPKLLPYTLDSTFRFTRGRGESSQLEGKDTDKGLDSQNQIGSQGILKSAHFVIECDNSPLASWDIEGSIKEGGRYFYEIIMPSNQLDEWVTRSVFQNKLDGSQEFRGEVILDGLLPSNRVYVKTESSGSGSLRQTIPLPFHIAEAFQDLRRALMRIHYLGPLRAPAQRYYVANLDVGPDLDPSGQFLPYVLSRDIANKRVRNIMPGSTEIRRDNLHTALNVWLHYLRTGNKEESHEIGTELQVSTSKGILVEFALRSLDGRERFPLADSGFGYSQVLPILVRSLIAGDNSAVIIEQAELHLNPALQVRLAEFFVAMVRTGRKIVIETHSEHLVNALRVLVAEDKSGELSTQCGIFYIDIDKNGPRVHELSVKENGTVPEWPMSFFGEAIDLTGRLLAAQKRFIKYADQ
jgi:predicted ATPase